MAEPRIQIDVWGGDLHQRLVVTYRVETWAQAFPMIEQQVEAGALVNVLHLDFQCPSERLDEQTAALLDVLKGHPDA